MANKQGESPAVTDGRKERASGGPQVDRRAQARHQSANMEDYLEAMRTLAGKHGSTTVTRLSDALGVSKPSVTAAIARLTGEGLVSHEKYGSVTLTARGRVVADDVWRRHQALRVFLMGILGVSRDTAEEDACKLEHHLSPVTSERLGRFVDFAFGGQSERPGWLEDFAATLGEPDKGLDSSCPHQPRLTLDSLEGM